MNYWIILGVIAFHYYSRAAHAAENPPDIPELAHKIIGRVPNAALAIGAIDHGTTRTWYFGQVNQEKPTPPDEHTLFELGSITKVYTALILAQLVENGTVSLDDPLSNYLPSDIPPIASDGTSITLRHLASHTALFPRLATNMGKYDLNNPYRDYDEKQMLEFLSTLQLHGKPGKSMKYSNVGFAVLGYALERASGQSYEELLRKYITARLSLNETQTTAAGELTARFADGYAGKSRTAHWDHQFKAYGSIISSLHDQLAFVAANLSTSSPLESAFQLSRKPQYRSWFSGNVGLGWQIQSVDEDPIYWHNGGTGGFRTFLAYQPAKQRAVVVLAACDNGAVDSVGFQLLESENFADAVTSNSEPVKN